jgi:hypothetical protein
MKSNFTEKEKKLLNKWSKMAQNYDLLHTKSYMNYQQKYYYLTIPVIILSTLTGSVNFTISYFPIDFQKYIPIIIGSINIFVGILQTVNNFFKISDKVSDHKLSSIQFDRFSRNIITELSLKPEDRKHNTYEFIQLCKKDLDGIINNSPTIPLKILNKLEHYIENDSILNNLEKKYEINSEQNKNLNSPILESNNPIINV